MPKRRICQKFTRTKIILNICYFKGCEFVKDVYRELTEHMLLQHACLECKILCEDINAHLILCSKNESTHKLGKLYFILKTKKPKRLAVDDGVVHRKLKRENSGKYMCTFPRCNFTTNVYIETSVHAREKHWCDDCKNPCIDIKLHMCEMQH